MSDTDICARKHGGADTSVDAFEGTPKPVRGKHRDLVLALITWSRVFGATTEEVSLALGIPYTAASARMSELKRDGLIVDSGLRRPTSRGVKARVMKVA